MYTLYFKIAVRYLLKHRLYSFINILGLAIGVTSFILIMLYVNHERSYDKFAGSEHVYRVYMDFLKGETFLPGDAQTYNLSGPELKKEFPEILDFTRFFHMEEATIVYDEKIFEESKGKMADPSYFEMFGQKLLKGDLNTALVEPNSIVLTRSVAEKIFGNDNPIGKTLSVFWGDNHPLKVTGVMDDITKNTHNKINYLISFSSINSWRQFKNEKEPNWSFQNYYTYIKIDQKADIDALHKKIIESDIDGDIDERHNIEPVEEIHLRSNKPYEIEANGSITRVKFLTTIAFIILILSWLNYINLSTTKSLERAKEIGIRKVAGAQKKQLILQSLLESIILNLLAISFAIVLAIILLPLYNEFTGKELTFGFYTLKSILPILGVILFGMILAGVYPAILLSSYNPTKALKGKIRTSSQGLNLRKGLIITQFMATIVLLIGAIIVTKQLNFLQEQPIGADLSTMVTLKGEVLNKQNDSILRKQFKTLEAELEKLPIVLEASLAQTYPGDSYDNLPSFTGLMYPDGTEDERIPYFNYTVQPDYFKLMDMKFLAGKTFLPTSKGRSNEVVVNEEFIRVIGITEPNAAVNQTIQFFGNEWKISGVVKDYHHFGLKSPVVPMIFLHGLRRDNLLVKLNPDIVSTGGYRDMIRQLESKWTTFFPQSTFDYIFLDKKFQAQYDEDIKFGNAFRIFTALAILIAALGLFGLTSYTCIQRKKEIGIRKVNGASIFKILKLLNIDFLKWIGIAFVLAIPIAWYVMSSWLENFALKTSLSWWVFVLAGVMALGITLLTVTWQSFMAASSNPVDALRDE